MQIYTNCGYNQSQLEKKSEIKKCEDKRMNPNVNNFISHRVQVGGTKHS